MALPLMMTLNCVVFTHGTQVGLYDETDLVEILDYTNFNKKVLESTTSYVIEFYNVYCGHCIRFSGPWKEFALEIHGNHLFVIITLFKILKTFDFFMVLNNYN